MEINEFINKFAEIFDDTDASALTPETKFRELDEWSSLTALGLIALADEEFDVDLKGDDVKKSETIGDLFNVIKSKA
jgi:acyl carrier protein